MLGNTRRAVRAKGNTCNGDVPHCPDVSLPLECHSVQWGASPLPLRSKGSVPFERSFATLLKTKFNSYTSLVSYALDHRTVTNNYISDKAMQEEMFVLDKLIAEDFGAFLAV